MFRRVGRLALPLILVVAVVGAPVAAHAALTTGSWQSPEAGATLSGTVTLQFKTQASSVTFEVPGYSSLPATISGGVASASYDTTKAPNGSATLTADECDISGCSQVPETVSIENVPSPPPYSFVPADGSTVAGGTSITVSGGSGTTDVTVYMGDSTRGNAFAFYYGVTLPLTIPVEAGPLDRDITVGIAGGLSATYHIPGVGYPPPTISVRGAPKVYFPHRDGYLDSFSVPIITGSYGTATLYLMSGGKVMSKGTAAIKNDLGSRNPFTVTAGGGLKPGRYSWYVAFIDDNGGTARSATYSVVADGRRLVWATRTLQLPGSYGAYDASGMCSHAQKKGSTEILHSVTTVCPILPIIPGIHSSNPTAAVVSIGLKLPKTLTPRYRALSVTVSFAGGPVFLAIEYAENGLDNYVYGPVVSKGPTISGHAGPSSIIEPQRIVNVVVGTGGGDTVTLTHIRFSYQYQTLAR